MKKHLIIWRGDKTKMENKDKIFEIARFILFFMTLIVVMVGTGFLFGIAIGWWSSILPLSIVIIWYALRNDIEKKDKIYIIAGASIIIIFTILFSMNTYDFTWDGNAYHKQAVGLLNDGWNPIYYISSNYNEIVKSSQLGSSGPLFWSEVYPKASWYFAAAIYSLIGNIEAGKCYTLLFAFVTFGISYNFFSKLYEKKYLSIFLALLSAFNPVVCAQFQSYYLDGIVSAVLTLLIFLFVDESNSDNIIKYKLEVISLIIWGCNLKFSVVLFVVTYCLIFIIYRSFSRKKIDWKNMFLLGETGIFSVFIIGCSPYLTNLKRYGNMFFGFFGMIDDKQMAKEFGVESLSHTGRFFASIFGKMSHGGITSLKSLLKFPFTVYKEELTMYSIVDTRVGGFGVFFSGLFVVAIIIILVRIFKYKKHPFSITFQVSMLYLVVSFIEMMFLPQTSQVRYIPQLYLIIIFAICEMSELYHWAKKKNVEKCCKVIILAIICGAVINLTPWIPTALRRVNDGVITTATFRGMSKECKDGKIYTISYSVDDYNGFDYNLRDFHIDYQYEKNANIDDQYKFTCNNMIRYK